MSAKRLAKSADSAPSATGEQSGHTGAPLTRLVAGLPATVPFTGPEALERRSGRPFILRLGANESNFGPSPQARDAMRAAVDRISCYADPECYDLRLALARQHGVGVEHIVVGSGIDELLGLIIRAFVEPGDTVVTAAGAYPTVPFHIAGYGGRQEAVTYLDDANGFRNDLDGLADAARRNHARLVYLANPDNPTGSWYRADAVRAFLDRLPTGSLLLLDEAYIELAPLGDPIVPDALLPINPDDPRLIRLRTFSKAYGMAGARVGYAIARPQVIASFDRIRLHFGVNLVAQVGALAALDGAAYLREVVAEVARGRDEYAALARELGMIPQPSATNFVAMDVGSPARARALLAALAEQGVFIRMPGAPPLDRCVRVTVGTPPERATFAKILRAVWPTVASAID
ncbi:MAG TPA: aminotransferase class I/II-fold pyridoxal phosphate-dependent enzyme [Ktedonobacterales bacterium]|nr:aminotransferase class I/II-fold pyridoxal phosphate-dependent enzyme [Ktedonobacterales bacterium]